MTETMKNNSISLLLLATLACLISLAPSSTNMAWGQLDSGFDGLNPGNEPSDDEPLTVTSWFKLKEGSSEGTLSVRAAIGEGRHLYSQHHGGREIKTSFMVAESDQYTVTGGFQPDVDPHKHQKDGDDYEEFEHEVTWTAPVAISEGVDPESIKIEITFRGQTCDATSCLPPVKEDLVAAFEGDEANLVIPESTGLPENTGTDEPKRHDWQAPKLVDTPEQIAAMAKLYDPETKIKYEKLDGSSGTGTFLAALFGAFVGGILLNLMPCVFPVLGLKVLGFVEQAGNDPKKIKMHGIAFAAGLIFCMWVLAGAILAIKYFWGQEVNWGQQMGNPYFVGGIVILLFVLGLNLAGVFEMGMFMTRAGGGEHKEGYFGSFLSGIITTLVATPCSGPFLGAAMGYTLAQPPAIAMFLFTVFGLGIALPYLILSFVPSLINLLPRPGAWMETFKMLMAFTLFAASAFFIRSFGTQTGVEGLSWFLMALCVIALAAFFYGKWSPAYVSKGKRFLWGWTVPLLIAGLGTWMYLESANLKAPQVASLDHGWELWMPGKVEQKLAENKPIWVDYTAEW